MADTFGVDEGRREQQRALFRKHKEDIKEREAEAEELSLKRKMEEAEKRKAVLRKMGESVPSDDFLPTPTGRETPATKALAERLKAKEDKPLTPAEIASFGPADPVKPPKASSFTETLNSGFSGLNTDAGSDAPPGAEAEKPDPFDSEAAAAKADRNSERDRLDTREAIEAVANGFGKIGAGLYGNKTGTDMSQVKFDKQDWERKRDRAQKDYQIDMEDIDSRRKQQTQKSQYDADIAYRNAVLGETKRHNKSLERLSGEKVAAASETALNKLNAKQLAEHKKRTDATSKEIFTITSQVSAGKMDQDLGNQRIKGLLMSNLDMSDEQATEVITDRGLFWDSAEDPDAIQAKVNALSSMQVTLKQLATQVPEGQTLVVNDKGVPGALPNDQLEAAKAAGWKVFH